MGNKKETKVPILPQVFFDLIMNFFLTCMVKKKLRDQSGIMKNFKPDPKSLSQTSKGQAFHLGLCTECLSFLPLM